MDYDKDWKIVESSFWCRHKLGDKCVFYSNPSHLCVSEKCPLSLGGRADRQIERLRNKFKEKWETSKLVFDPEQIQEAWDKVAKKHNKRRKKKP